MEELHFSGQVEALPQTAAGCRQRLVALQDEIASLRIHIATTDIRRQGDKKPLDATWFHRAKTALRFKIQERAMVAAELHRLEASQPGQLQAGSSGGRERFKDALIQVFRAQCDDDQWARALGCARERLDRAERLHG